MINRAVTPYAHASWAIPFIQRIPGLTDPRQIGTMREFGKLSTVNRLKLGAKRKDLFYHLVRPPTLLLKLYMLMMMGLVCLHV